MLRKIIDTLFMRATLWFLDTSLGQFAVAQLALRMPAHQPSVNSKSLKTCGDRVRFQGPSWIEQPEEVVIGDDVSFAGYVHIWGAGGVRIGARTMIGAHTAISSVTHDYTRADMYTTVVLKPVEIAQDVWIGSHSMIMAGVTIGEGAVIGAGSIVTHDVAPFTIVAGVPARMIKQRMISSE
ncbi:MAG: acyltransferase [Caldilineaceae bacterium]